MFNLSLYTDNIMIKLIADRIKSVHVATPYYTKKGGKTPTMLQKVSLLILLDNYIAKLVNCTIVFKKENEFLTIKF